MAAPKVLVMDDSAFMREKLKDLIAEAGGEVVGEAENGEKGIEQFRLLDPDIVFIDVIMPGMSGIQALEKMSEINPDAHFVMCTSINQEHLIQDSISKGANDYISKPFKDDEVKAIIDDFVLNRS